jgi:hypothetical protein
MAMAIGGSILAASTAGGENDDDASGIAKCMTINAVVGKNNFDARNYLLDGLDKIKSRGYDGAGIATMAATRGDMVRKTHTNIYIIISASCFVMLLVLCNFYIQPTTSLPHTQLKHTLTQIQ